MYRQKGRSGSGSESGFTLIELLTTMMIVSVLVTLGALALRQYWFVRSLEGGKDGMITTLRGIQQRVTSASNPLVYGARFRVGSSVWQLIEYNRVGRTCTDIRVEGLESDQEFDAGVHVTSAGFADYLDPPVAPHATTLNATDACLGTGTGIVWFFARGSATTGSVTLRQPVIGRSETICVAGLTGRVYEQEGGSC